MSRTLVEKELEDALGKRDVILFLLESYIKELKNLNEKIEGLMKLYREQLIENIKNSK